MDLLRGLGPWLGGIRGSWVVAAVAGLAATTLVGVTVLRPAAAGRISVTLEPAGVAGDNPFLVLDSPDIRLGAALELSLDGGVTVRVGIEPGLYGGSGSDHLCDPQLIADFLAQDSAKASAWASAAGIGVDEIDEFLTTLTPVRLLADTWVTNHGYRDGRAIPRQSILQAGTMVLVDEYGVPRVRCKCGNPLGPAEVPSDLSAVDFVGEPWDGFDRDELLVIEAGDEAVEFFILVRLEDGRLIARPVGTVGDQDVLVDEDGNWIPELDIELPPEAAVGDGPFRLPDATSAGVELIYEVTGPCRVRDGALVLDGEGVCTVSVRSEAEAPWAPVDETFEIDVGRLDQTISVSDIGRVVLGEGPVVLGAVSDSLLPVTYEASGPCTMNGDQLVPTGVGACQIVITQEGDERWDAAEPVEVTVDIVGDPPRTEVTLTFSLPASVRLDGRSITLDATTNPRRPVTYQAAGACSIEGGDTLVATTVGDCTVVAVAVDNDEFQRAIDQDTLSVLPRLQTLGLDGVPRAAVLSSAAVPLPVTTSAGFEITYDVSGECRLTADGLVLTGAGTCELVASASGDRETEPITETVEITITDAPVVRQGQTITFARPDDLVVGGSGVTLSATASSDLAVTLTVTSGDCTLTGRTLTPGDAGRCTIVASQNGDADYEPADSVTQTITVARRTPTITVSLSGGPSDEMVAGETRTVTITVSNGPAGSITDTSGPCTSSGRTITATGSSAGTCQITVGTAGDGNHNPVSTSVSIGVKLTQTVTVSVSSTSIFVDGRTEAGATASSGLSVTLSAGPSSVCTLSGGTVVGVGAGTCTVTGDQAGNGSYVAASGTRSIQVNPKRTPVVTISAPSSIAVGERAAVTATSSESGVTITIDASGSACAEQSAGAIVGVARGTCTITATHPETDGAAAGSATATITVTGVDDRIIFDCIGICDIGVGEQVGVAIVSESGLTPTASIDGPCTIVARDGGGGSLTVLVRGDGSGGCTLQASTPGDDAWNPVSSSFPITVSQQIDLVPVLGSDFFDGSCSGRTCTHRLRFTVRNDGTSGSPQTTVTVNVTPNGPVTVTVPAIGAGRSTTIETSVTGTWCFDPDCFISVTVDPGNGVAETNESNNTATWSAIG